MTNNLIPNICSLLGVEMGEPFEVENDDNLYWFDLTGLHSPTCGVEDTKLRELILGSDAIVKAPWKPKAGEMYWTFGPYSLQDPLWVVTSARWKNSPNEIALLEHGWVFNSRKAAEDMLPSAAQVRGFRYYTTSGATGKK